MLEKVEQLIKGHETQIEKHIRCITQCEDRIEEHKEESAKRMKALEELRVIREFILKNVNGAKSTTVFKALPNIENPPVRPKSVARQNGPTAAIKTVLPTDDPSSVTSDSLADAVIALRQGGTEYPHTRKALRDAASAFLLARVRGERSNIPWEVVFTGRKRGRMPVYSVSRRQSTQGELGV